MTSVPARLLCSRHLSWFGHMDAVYLFHDLYGYIMQMSPDIAAMIAAFGDGVDTAATIEAHRGKLSGGDPQEFTEILIGHQVLIEPDEDEIEGMWTFVPIKGKWNIWQRRSVDGETRMTIWTAWGERPVQQIFLDPEETRMWDAFDGNKRLLELKAQFEPAKLLALARRLVHSNVQALKMSAMPWSTFAKRPAMAPPYLTSTMPFQSWTIGDPVPSKLNLHDYHRGSIPDADLQFDHQETTLSHLLRIPHPVLRGRTYGQALIDVLLERGAIPDGRIRVLEIGAGLGYIARDAIARLRDRGRTVEYTIVELSPVLAASQQARVGDAATWVSGDVLAVTLPDASFDLIISNEMAGDLPAREMTRPELGLTAEGGEVDRERLRSIGGGAAIAADLNVNLDDAPETFYLQTGAFELVARMARWLAPGGTMILTEFGDSSAWPKMSTHLDHPELSTHFGQLQQAARASGLDAGTEFVIDVLDFDRDLKGLATTRSHFRALRALAADSGIDLPKLGYTPELLAETIGGKLDLTTVGELRWDKIEDRLMGLVPHEFKALIARRS